MASKSKSSKREKHAVYFVVFANDHSNIVSGPLASKAEAVKQAEADIRQLSLAGPFALLKTRTDVVATFDIVTETVSKLAKL